MVRAALVRVSDRWGGIDVAVVVVVVVVIATILAAAATTAEVVQVTIVIMIIVIILEVVKCRTCAGGKGPAAPSWRIRHRTRA